MNNWTACDEEQFWDLVSGSEYAFDGAEADFDAVIRRLETAGIPYSYVLRECGMYDRVGIRTVAGIVAQQSVY